MGEAGIEQAAGQCPGRRTGGQRGAGEPVPDLARAARRQPQYPNRRAADQHQAARDEPDVGIGEQPQASRRRRRTGFGQPDAGYWAAKPARGLSSQSWAGGRRGAIVTGTGVRGEDGEVRCEWSTDGRGTATAGDAPSDVSAASP